MVVEVGLPTQAFVEHRSCMNAAKVKTYEPYFTAGFELFNLSDKCSYLDTCEAKSIVMSAE